MKHFLYQQLRLAPDENVDSVIIKSVGNQQIKHKPQII
jgi:hypothetical protein